VLIIVLEGGGCIFGILMAHFSLLSLSVGRQISPSSDQFLQVDNYSKQAL
jgi:hypothetical protein